jgi:hypothetical protein
MFFRRDGQTIIEVSMRNGLYIVTHVADRYEETAFNAFPATEQEEAEVETVRIPRVKKLTLKQDQLLPIALSDESPQPGKDSQPVQGHNPKFTN